MKIRILNNAIRLRLSQSDIKTLVDTGVVIHDVNFPNGKTLTYGLYIHPDNRITSSFESSAIKVFLPQLFLTEWVASDRVGYDTMVEMPDKNTFKILIEKDFKCLTDRAEDESDLFRHPNEEDSNC